MYGPDATVDPNTGAVIDKGHAAGSIVVEMHDWASHQLTTMVFAIVASEVVCCISSL